MSTDAEVDALVHGIDLVAYASQYLQLTKSGAEWKAICPWHDDHSPSLSINGNKQVWACWSCGAQEKFGADLIGFVRSWYDCTFPEAIAKLQNGNGAGTAKPIIRPALKKAPPRQMLVPPEGSMPDMEREDLGSPVKVWTIRTPAGEPWYLEARYMKAGAKETRFYTWGRYSDADPPKWECKAPARPRPLYGLDELARRPTAQVMIHEAPKKAEAGQALFPKLVHLGIVGGVYQVAHMDLTPLAGRRCILLPDNDEAGKQAMSRLAPLLWAAGAAEVKGVDPETQPDGSLSPEGFDIADTTDWTPAVALEWAKGRKMDYPNDAAQQVSVSARTDEHTVAPASASPANSAAAASPSPSAPEPPPAPPDDPGPTAPPGTPKARKTPPDLALVDETGALRKPRQEIDPEPEQLPAFSEFALAQRFADGSGADWRYTAAWLQWAKWDGIRWVPDECKRITWETKELCKSAMQEHISDSTPSQRLRITTLKTVNAVMGLACAYPGVAVGANAWDADPWLLGTPGGIVDLRTGELVASERRQLISKATLVAPQDGSHPLFDRVLARPGSSAEMLDFLWRWLGYFLTGDVREERFMFLHGVGGSGKGTLIKVIADILGDYGRAIAIQAFTESQHQRHSQEIAKLQGARLVYASETEEGSRFDEAMLKWLTGRDKITAHKMRQDDIEFYPQFKLLIYGNNRPSLKSVGEDMRRRIDLIEFPGSIPEAERDTGLKDKLRAEYPAILASMIRACVRWQVEGLGKPEPVAAATENYLKMNDVLGEFIDDCLDVSADAYSPSGAAYKRFSAYCSDRGERYVMSHRTFTQRLEARGYPAAKVGGLRIYRGFKIRATGYEPDPGSWQDPDR